MINIAINAGSAGRGGSSALDNLKKLQRAFEYFPEEIAAANQLAAQVSVEEIKENIGKRGKLGKSVTVTSSRYGPFGFKVTVSPAAQAGSGGRSAKGKYDLRIATRIFLESEMGRIGRTSFTLPKRNQNDPYVVSHNSGDYRIGDKIIGPVPVPEIGPFYFSANSGVERKPINKAASEIIINNLNRRYRTVFRMIGRNRLDGYLIQGR